LLNFPEVAKDAEKDTFAEKLFTNVVKNLELTVTNIHVRYEDRVTNPTCPFSVGVTLHELSCRVGSLCDLLSLITEFIADGPVGQSINQLIFIVA